MIRTPRASDQGYIASTWLRSLASLDRGRSLGHRFGQLGKDVDAVLDRGDTRALVRHDPADADSIWGWLVYADGIGVPVVHYAYVRSKGRGVPLRQQGIATEMLTAIGVSRETPVVCTSLGPSSAVLRRAFKACAYMPLNEFLK